MKNHPIEIAPPDIAPYKTGNTGVDYVHVLDSGRPGPNVMVQALTHGNEFCGAIALDFFFNQKLKPTQGKLILAFANVAAFARFDFDDPDRSRYIDEDYNRVWGDEALLGPRDSAELRRARQLRPFVDAADYLLDLHSMHEPCRPIMVCGAQDKGAAKSAALSRRIGVPGDLLVDTGHPAGLRMIERGGLGDPASPRTAVLIECGQHWEKGAADVAVDTLFRFLLATGAVNASICKSHTRLAPPAVQRLVRVTEAVVAKSMDFRFPYLFKGLEVIPKAGTVVASDGAAVWKTPYDDCVMVMPSLAHVKPGTTVCGWAGMTDLRLPVLAVLLACAVPASAQIYRWVDAQGRVNFSNTAPPQGVKSTVVDANAKEGQPSAESAECYTIRCQGERLEERERKREAELEKETAARAAAEPKRARGLEFRKYISIQRGMSEGELLGIAGEPDLLADHGVALAAPTTVQFGRNYSTAARAGLVMKTYTYMPTSADPFTTTITLVGGRVDDIERVRKF